MDLFSFKSPNFCSIDVKGLRDSTKQKAVFLFSWSCNIDIVFLQETYMKNSGNHNGEMKCIFLMAQITQMELQYYQTDLLVIFWSLKWMPVDYFSFDGGQCVYYL